MDFAYFRQEFLKKKKFPNKKKMIVQISVLDFVKLKQLELGGPLITWLLRIDPTMRDLDMVGHLWMGSSKRGRE